MDRQQQPAAATAAAAAAPPAAGAAAGDTEMAEAGEAAEEGAEEGEDIEDGGAPERPAAAAATAPPAASEVPPPDLSCQHREKTLRRAGAAGWCRGSHSARSRGAIPVPFDPVKFATGWAGSILPAGVQRNVRAPAALSSVLFLALAHSVGSPAEVVF